MSEFYFGQEGRRLQITNPPITCMYPCFCSICSEAFLNLRDSVIHSVSPTVDMYAHVETLMEISINKLISVFS